MVTGSRDWTDSEFIFQELEKAFIELGSDPETILIHGSCPRGVDSFANFYWKRLGRPQKKFYPDWNKHGKSAGPKRNAEMVAENPDIVLAFPLGSSPGTRGTIKMALRAGLDVRVFEELPRHHS